MYWVEYHFLSNPASSILLYVSMQGKKARYITLNIIFSAASLFLHVSLQGNKTTYTLGWISFSQQPWMSFFLAKSWDPFCLRSFSRFYFKCLTSERFWNFFSVASSYWPRIWLTYFFKHCKWTEKKYSRTYIRGCWPQLTEDKSGNILTVLLETIYKENEMQWHMYCFFWVPI